MHFFLNYSLYFIVFLFPFFLIYFFHAAQEVGICGREFQGSLPVAQASRRREPRYSCLALLGPCPLALVPPLTPPTSSMPHFVSLFCKSPLCLPQSWIERKRKWATDALFRSSFRSPLFDWSRFQQPRWPAPFTGFFWRSWESRKPFRNTSVLSNLFDKKNFRHGCPKNCDC